MAVQQVCTRLATAVAAARVECNGVIQDDGIPSPITQCGGGGSNDNIFLKHDYSAHRCTKRRERVIFKFFLSARLNPGP